MTQTDFEIISDEEVSIRFKKKAFLVTEPFIRCEKVPFWKKLNSLLEQKDHWCIFFYIP